MARHVFKGRTCRSVTGNTLILLISGLVLFIVMHAFRELGWRDPLVHTLGRIRYKLLVCSGIAGSLVLMTIGKSGAPFVQIWVPPFPLRDMTLLVMISSSIVFFAGLLPASHTRALVGHPMLVGVFLWGIAHLASNGDLASMLLFGSLACWAVWKFIVLERRRGQTQQRHSETPALQWDAAAILLGMIAYGALLVFHGPLFGFALTGPV